MGIGSAIVRIAPKVGGYIANGIIIAGPIVEGLRNQVPRLEDEVVVTIHGQPGAKKSELYLLALATASSLVRRYDGTFGQTDPAPGMIAVEYDAASNWIRCTLRYNTSMAAAVKAFDGNQVLTAVREAKGQQVADQVGKYQQGNGSAPDAGGKQSSMFSELVVYSGPRDEVQGENLNFTGSLPGMPTSVTAKGLPQIPWVGRTILTTAPKCVEPIPGTGPIAGNVIQTPDPKPPGDNRSRGAIISSTNPLLTAPGAFTNATALLIPMVFASLTDPGGSSLEGFPPPQPGPTGQ